MRAVVIYNPVSGSGTSERISALAEQHLASRGWCVERIATRAESGASRIARDIASRVSLVAVVGGDGSLQEVIEGLGDEVRRVVIGIIPTGNANVIARELKIPLRAQAALPLLSCGMPRSVDVGFAEGRFFVAMIGIGFDALVARGVSRLRRSRCGGAWYRTWADSVYAVMGLWVAFRPGAPRLRVRCDGRDVGGRFRALIVSNTETYGKGWSMVPAAHITTAKLHYQARLRSATPFVAWAFLAAMFRRRLPARTCAYGSGRRIVIEADRPFPLQIDGDFRGFRQHVEAEIRAGAVRILAPPPGWTGRSRSVARVDVREEQ